MAGIRNHNHEAINLCLFICLFTCSFVCLCVCLFGCLFLCLNEGSNLVKFVCLSVCLMVVGIVCLSVCLVVWKGKKLSQEAIHNEQEARSKTQQQQQLS